MIMQKCFFKSTFLRPTISTKHRSFMKAFREILKVKGEFLEIYANSYDFKNIKFAMKFMPFFSSAVNLHRFYRGVI